MTYSNSASLRIRSNETFEFKSASDPTKIARYPLCAKLLCLTHGFSDSYCASASKSLTPDLGVTPDLRKLTNTYSSYTPVLFKVNIWGNFHFLMRAHFSSRTFQDHCITTLVLRLKICIITDVFCAVVLYPFFRQVLTSLIGKGFSIEQTACVTCK